MFKNLFSKAKAKDEELTNSEINESKELKEEVDESASVNESSKDYNPDDLIDMEIALTNCGYMEDMLKEMLDLFADSKDEKKAEIAEEYANEVWEDYRIHVHALKSTALTVGCVPLHELAKDIELTAKDYLAEEDEAKKVEQIAHIKAHHDEMMDLYDKTVKVVKDKAAEIVVEED
ncbi:MAG: Hpt domain-containing protein [Lachnospiraceae bacterium]|nr:Hpt domain-containing protein [Lachnospiraceae bacterium]